MRLLLDMNLSPRWVPWLANAGFQVHHWSTIGAFNATDAEIMGYAASNNSVVVTNDLDFGAILAATQRKKPSVV
jgi:predicted nuclease of predicted toxin-antitoxin system